MQIELLKFPYSYMEYEKILQIRELKVLLPEIEVLSDDKHMITKCALCQPKIKNTHSFQLMQHHISETMGNDLDI